MVGDGDTVSIAAEILQDVLGSAEGWFGVDDPVFAEERTQPGREELGMVERCEFSGQVQLATLEGRLQTCDELAAKHAPQYGNGKEEAWVGSNPAGVIAGESTGGNDTVDMGMKLELLVPGVKHAEEADLSSEMGGIVRELGVTPHVARRQNGAIDERTSRHSGYAISLSKRWLVEKPFGWLKQIGPLKKVKLRGLAKVDWLFVFSCAAFNLLRIPKLRAQSA